MTLEEYIRKVAANPVGKHPRTLQDVINRRVLLDSYAADTTSATRLTPRVVWRLAWLSLRQVQLIPSRLPEPRIIDLCNAYTRRLIGFAGWLHREHPHDRPAAQILTRYFAESAEFWGQLETAVDATEPLAWTDQDVSSLLWIRLCTFYACVSVTQQGRPRSRRELASILGRALEEKANPNSLRLRVVPSIEADMAIADRWATVCADRQIMADPSPTAHESASRPRMKAPRQRERHTHAAVSASSRDLRERS